MPKPILGTCFCKRAVFFVGLVYLIKTYKNQVSFCREHLFLVMQNRGHKSPHFVGDMLVKQKRVNWFYFAWALML